MNRLPKASKLSTHNGQLLISTGIPSLDENIGGGLPIGSLMLIKEDFTSLYANLLLKYFMAQGLASDHDVLFASSDLTGFMGSNHDGGSVFSELMGWQDMPKDDRKTSSSGLLVDLATENEPKLVNQQDEKMKIAWRYEKQSSVQERMQQVSISGASKASFQKGASRLFKPKTEDTKEKNQTVSNQTPFCQVFDLQSTISPLVLENTKDHQFILDLGSSEEPYARLYKDIATKIAQFYNISAPLNSEGRMNTLRISIHSIGTPLWKNEDLQSLARFLHALRGLLRYSLATCVITMPVFLHPEAECAFLESLCDVVVRLSSFTNDKSPFSKDYHGIIDIEKLPRLNSMISVGSTQQNLGFKCRRRKFCIEPLCLPPELSDEPAQKKTDTQKPSKSSIEKW